MLDAIHAAYACIENANAPKLRPGLVLTDLSLRPDPARPIEVEITFSLDDVERREIADLRRKIGDEMLGAVEGVLSVSCEIDEEGRLRFEAGSRFANQALRGRALAMIARKRKLVTEGVFDRVGGIQYLDQHRSVVVRAPWGEVTRSAEELAVQAGGDGILPWLEFVNRLHQKWDSALQGESSWSKVRRVFNLLAAPAQLEDVVASDEGFDLRIRGESGVYGANGMSSGEQQVLRLACNLVARRASRSVVLIDEYELHLHPAWQRNVLHFLRSGGGGDNQFLVTTHSESALRYTLPDEVVTLVPLEV